MNLYETKYPHKVIYELRKCFFGGFLYIGYKKDGRVFIQCMPGKVDPRAIIEITERGAAYLRARKNKPKEKYLKIKDIGKMKTWPQQ